jgi:pantoate--beta-alanine ligase
MTPLPVFRDKESMRQWCNLSRSDGKKVALVPTMGYLHNGHLSLVATAREAGADVVVVRTCSL